MLMHKQHLYTRDRIIYLWSLKITITLTEVAPLIFLKTGIKKLHAWAGIELTSLDLGSQSGTFDLSVSATHV